MNEVIRLIRLALLLQLLINSVVISASGLPTPAASQPGIVLILLCTAPSLSIVALTVLAQRRAWISRRVVIALLGAVIVAFAVESTGAALSALTLPAGAPVMPRQAPALFLFIPTVLGAWVSGRRGAALWAGLASVALLTSGLAVLAVTGSGTATDPLPLVAQAATMTILCFFVGTLADRQRAEHAALHTAHQQLTDQTLVREQLAASRERLRLARDLHDTLAHTLAGLLVQLRAVQTLAVAAPERVPAELALAEQAARSGLVETRAAIANLRGNQIDDLGLAGALRQALDTLASQSGLRTSFVQTGVEPLLPETTGATIYLIAQEALRNIARHAHATHVTLTLRASAGLPLTLLIQDDGIGFEATAVAPTRFGLRGLHERAELIGARLQIVSARAAGTTVLLTLDGSANDE